MSVEFASEGIAGRDLGLQYHVTLPRSRVIYTAAKRILDLAAAIPGTILLIPTAALVKLAYVATGDFAPIFYTQARIGKRGKIFRIYKFRTMTTGAEAELATILTNPKLFKEYTTTHKLTHDPRITKAGHIVRRYSIDELPQFLNILAGHMSLVGNRPYMLKEKSDMGAYYIDIIKTKPGLTGIWQVSGRNDLSFARRLHLEADYSSSASLAGDFRIFHKTFAAVFKANGAK